MIRSIDIDNFRGYRSLRLEGLRRFNIIVGPNGAGKTALLEAIFMAATNSPEGAFRIRSWRGQGFQLQISRRKPAYDALWSDLFFSEENKSFDIVLRDSEVGERSCRAFFNGDGAQQLLSGDVGGGGIESASIIPITFEWKNRDKVYSSTVTISDANQIQFKSVEPAKFLSVFLNDISQKLASEEMATRYSELRKSNSHRGVLGAVQELFPFITELSNEVDPSGFTLYAQVSGVARLLPVAMVSAGVQKYLSILLSIHFCRHGVLLIDEIESGLYYDVIEKVIASLLAECRKTDTQVFTVTHSMEFLRRILPTIRQHPEDFCLLRARRADTGECRVRLVPGDVMEAAIDQNLEVR